jgi:hypothetical protein
MTELSRARWELIAEQAANPPRVGSLAGRVQKTRLAILQKRVGQLQAQRTFHRRWVAAGCPQYWLRGYR